MPHARFLSPDLLFERGPDPLPEPKRWPLFVAAMLAALFTAGVALGAAGAQPAP